MAQSISSRVKPDDIPLKRIVKIYDVKTKELLYTCESGSEAERITGVRNVRVYIKAKSRSYKNKLGKTICFR